MQSRQVLLAEGDGLALPAALRSEMGLHPGNVVIVDVEDRELRIRSIDSALKRVQDQMRTLNPTRRSLVYDLILDRRKAAEGE